MLKIRLARVGKRNQAMYRIVVKEERSKRQGEYTAILGSYDPKTNPITLTLDKEAYADWVKKGAQPTEAVERLVLSKEEKEKRWPSLPKKTVEKKKE